MDGIFSKAMLWTAVGVALGLIVNSMVAGVANPILANLKVSVAVTTG